MSVDHLASPSNNASAPPGEKAGPGDNAAPFFSVENLSVEFDTYGGIVKAVRDVGFSVREGTTLGVVGESGSGKSVMVQAIMGLIPMPPGRIVQGRAYLAGEKILDADKNYLKRVGGRDIGMIFQDPMTALNPTMKVGRQIAEPLRVHQGLSAKAALMRAEELLALTKIPEPGRRAQQYPFEFSGGMLQRVMIAMSLACNPKLLIADEPTTALDVTIQAQVLEVMRDIQKSEGMTIILITHDLGVVANMADDVVVMYAGQIVESGAVDNIFYHPRHPYSIGLRKAMPTNCEGGNIPLAPIEGSPPDLFSPPLGCGYFARCSHRMKVCEQQPPPAFSHLPTGTARCWLQHPSAPLVDGEIIQGN